jgi:hypothetical protein
MAEKMELTRGHHGSACNIIGCVEHPKVKKKSNFHSKSIQLININTQIQAC